MPTWDTLQNGTPSAAPVYLTLATALIGPGPALTQGSGTSFQIGDGNDGPGFRCQTSNAIPGMGSVSAGSESASFTVNAQYQTQANAFLNNFTSGTGGTEASMTFFSSVAGYPYQETIGIKAMFSLSQITLNAPASASHTSVNCLIFIPGGKVWGPYISADNFKIAFVPTSDVNGNSLGGPNSNTIGPAGEPVLLDHWGQVIQYFPTYGPVSNRSNDSASYPGGANTTVSYGPLYGYSQPNSVDTNKNGQNAIWDFRDGAPFFSVNSSSSPAQPWPNPYATTNGFYPSLAIQWMLGVSLPAVPTTVSSPLGNVILNTASDKLSFTGPYILISAGPGGPDRLNGGYCNMVDSSGNLLPPNTSQQTFINSGNIYNFDRQ